MTLSAWYAAFAVILLAAAIAFWSKRWWILAPALAVVLAAGFLPRAVDVAVLAEEEAVEISEDTAAEMAFQEQHLAWSDDIATRVEESRPWTADEGFAFLEFAADSDLTWRSLPDHTPQAFALVEEALAEKILDPDALTTAAGVADSPAVTLTMLWYDRRVRPGSPRAIDRHDWAVLQMLVAANADLTADDAAPLREDLAKIVIDDGGRFIRLEWGEIEAVPVAPPEAEIAPVEDGTEDTGAE
jgi:hypothetical protein